MAATDRLFLQADGTPQPRGQAIPGGKSVGVPGNVAMLRAGARELRQAAVGGAVRARRSRLARDGYDVTPARWPSRSPAARGRSRASRPRRRCSSIADGTPQAVGAQIAQPGTGARR